MDSSTSSSTSPAPAPPPGIDPVTWRLYLRCVRTHRRYRRACSRANLLYRLQAEAEAAIPPVADRHNRAGARLAARLRALGLPLGDIDGEEPSMVLGDHSVHLRETGGEGAELGVELHPIHRPVAPAV